MSAINLPQCMQVGFGLSLFMYLSRSRLPHVAQLSAASEKNPAPLSAQRCGIRDGRGPSNPMLRRGWMRRMA